MMGEPEPTCCLCFADKMRMPKQIRTKRANGNVYRSLRAHSTLQKVVRQRPQTNTHAHSGKPIVWAARWRCTAAAPPRAQPPRISMVQALAGRRLRAQFFSKRLAHYNSPRCCRRPRASITAQCNEMKSAVFHRHFFNLLLLLQTCPMSFPYHRSIRNIICENCQCATNR